jgi:hypothetical protein
MVSSLDWSFHPGTNPMAGTSYYREAAMLVQWYLGRYGTRNRRQFMRKWIHPFGGSIVPATVVDGTTKFASVPSDFQVYMDRVTSLDPPSAGLGPYQLCTKEGRSGGAATLYPYLEHRQFGR